ncbi:MAG: proton-conducting transporter membrane subunit, partial [Gammaproteobacteria bacterium]
MIAPGFSLTLLLLVAWPLLLVAGLVFEGSRATLLKLVPWSALPVLVAAAVLATDKLQLPFVMLGSGLVLDASARVFLLLNAGLWLATGLLAGSKLRGAGAERFAILLLLAMAGSFCLALAADAALFFAASTLTAYSLYAMLAYQADASAQPANRVLLVLLVVSDLLVFELLLLLGQSAGSVDFTALRQALVNTDNRGLVVALLLFGFGIKTGVLGVHFWLKPVFVSAMPALRPALTGFMFSAGLLGWLRLLPAGELYLLDMGAGLQWLAWATLVYAVVLGMLHVHHRALLAYAAIVLGSLWLVLLGAAQPSLLVSNAITSTIYATVLQAGFAITALLLAGRCSLLTEAVSLRFLFAGVRWLAVLLLVTAPLGVAAAVQGFNDAVAMQLDWVAAAITFLAVRGVLLMPASINADAGDHTLHSDVQPAADLQGARSLLVSIALTLAALLAATYNLSLQWNSGLLQSGLMIAAAAAAAWLGVA